MNLKSEHIQNIWSLTSHPVFSGSAQETHEEPVVGRYSRAESHRDMKMRWRPYSWSLSSGASRRIIRTLLQPYKKQFIKDISDTHTPINYTRTSWKRRFCSTSKHQTLCWGNPEANMVEEALVCLHHSVSIIEATAEDSRKSAIGRQRQIERERGGERGQRERERERERDGRHVKSTYKEECSGVKWKREIDEMKSGGGG